MTDLPEGALRVVATIPTDPDQAADTGAALAALAAASLAEEGCLSYEVFESAAAPGTFVVVEAYGSQADLDAHMTSPHIAEAFTVLGARLAGDIAIHPLRQV